jgi:hypothetical protein
MRENTIGYPRYLPGQPTPAKPNGGDDLASSTKNLLQNLGLRPARTALGFALSQGRATTKNHADQSTPDRL